MKVTLENTDRIVELIVGDGKRIPARLWEGRTESGIPCHAFITRILVAKDADTAQFERELQEQRPPRAADLNDLFPHGIPTRLVI